MLPRLRGDGRPCSTPSDMIFHDISRMPLWDSIYQTAHSTAWLVDYLEHRRHFTIFEEQTSSAAVINAGVAQDLVIGPQVFIIIRIAGLH